MVRPWWPWSTASLPASSLARKGSTPSCIAAKGGMGRGGRQKLEADRVDILSGTWQGHSIGSPIALLVPNRDYKIEQMGGSSASPAGTWRPERFNQTSPDRFAACWSGPALARRPCELRPARWPSSCLVPLGSRCLAMWSRLIRLRFSPGPGTLQEQRAMRERSELYTLDPDRDAGAEIADRTKRPSRATRWAESSRFGSRAFPSGWVHTRNGTRSSTADWPRP